MKRKKVIHWMQERRVKKLFPAYYAKWSKIWMATKFHDVITLHGRIKVLEVET